MGTGIAMASVIYIPLMCIIGVLIHVFAKRSVSHAEQQAAEQVGEIQEKMEKEQLTKHRMEMAFQYIQNYTPYLIFIVNHFKEIEGCSVSAARLLGYPEGKIPGKLGLSSLLESGVEKKILDEIVETLENGHEYYNVLYFSLKGGEGTYQVHAQNVMEEGKKCGSIIFLTDVTHQVRQNEKVIEAIRMRDRLILTMSHEVRTPLNAIIGSADLMTLTDSLSEKERVHMQNIREASHALLNIVNETIDYAKIESNEMKVENKRFDFLESLLQIRTALYIKTLKKGIDFFMDIEPDISKHIVGDEARLRQVLSHLLSNAIKYTDEGYIKLRIRKQDKAGRMYFCYEVIDTGIGIRVENQKDIFKAFSPAGEKEYEYRSGIGLGLTVCQKLVSLMGGKILCHSEVGKGTTFSFELETVGSENDPIAKVNAADQKSLLICSDDALLAKHLVEMAGQMGVRAVWNREMNLVEEFYTHILIDNKMKNVREWLEREMLYSCEKILVIEDSRSASSAMKKADRVVYYPICCNMIAGILNKSDLSRFKQKKCGNREMIFEVKGLSALIVDDNSVNTLVAANILKQFGFETEEAASAALAIKKVYGKAYDFIFMDYLMPEMDGIEATQEIRKLDLGKKSVIIALTANITDEIAGRFHNVGADDMLAKPIELKDLSELLQKWIPEEQLKKEEPEKEEKQALGKKEEINIQETAEKGTTQRDKLEKAMQKMTEIDLELGLSHVLGDLNGYTKVLEISNTNISQAYESIKALMKEEQYDEMRIHFHSLKGIFANIGGQDISEQSKKMEFAARDHDIVFVRTYLEDYLGRVNDFMSCLSDSLSSYKKENGEEKEEETAEILKEDEKQELLEQLSYLISRFEINDIGEIFNRLIRGTQGEEKEKLVRANNEIENFQYDKALEILGKKQKE